MSRFCVALGVLSLIVMAGGGCGGDDRTTIALLLQGYGSVRHEEATRAGFERSVEAFCSSCEVHYANAQAKSWVQRRQSEEALREGADVLVVDPVTPNHADQIVRKAEARGVPVLAFRHLILESSYGAYVAYGNSKTGEVQAASLSRRLSRKGHPRGPIVVVNGEPGEQPQHEFKRGAHAGFDRARVEIADEFFTAFSAAHEAKHKMQRAIRKLGHAGFKGIYAETDTLAGGAIEALRGAGISPSSVPITGREASVRGLQQILAGKQYMTTYEPIAPLSDAAARFAVMLAEDMEIPQSRINGRVGNYWTRISSVLLVPTAVTKQNIGSTVIADGYVSRAQLCAGNFLALCVENGIEGGSESGGGGSIGRAEFIEKADEICADSHREIAVKGVAELRKSVKAGKSKEEIEADVLEGLLVPTLEDELEAIRGLGAPAGDEKEVEAFLDAFEEVIAEAKEDPETFIQSSGEYTFGHYRKPGHLMAAYGLSGCPQG